MYSYKTLTYNKTIKGLPNGDVFMRITAHDAHTRIALSRLLLKIDQDQEYRRETGMENTSFFQAEPELKEKEGRENVKSDTDHIVCSRSV
jgi:hypothetical protein